MSDFPAFADPLWIQAWLAAFAPDEHTLTLGDAPGVLLRQGELRLHGLRLPALLSPTNAHTPRYACWTQQPTVAQLSDWLAQSRQQWPWQVLQLELVPEHSPTHRAFAQLADAGAWVEIRPAEITAVVDLSQGQTAYFQSLSKKLRANTNNAENGLRRLGELQCLDVAGQPDWLDWLERAFALEAEGWKGEQGSAIAQNTALQRFYRGVLMHGHAQGRLRFFVLLLDARLIAFQILWRADGSDYGLRTGFVEDLAKYSPGNVLQRMSTQALFDAGGASKLDMLGPVTPWKARWQTGEEALLRIRVYAPGWRTALIYHALRQFHRFNDWRHRNKAGVNHA